jgi:hypothetical protein
MNETPKTTKTVKKEERTKKKAHKNRASTRMKSKKFLSTTLHKVRLCVSGNIKNPNFKQKSWQTAKYLFEVTITGLLAWYALHHPTSLIGIAIIIAMTAYYVEWLITLIKRPYENTKEE